MTATVSLPLPPTANHTYRPVRINGHYSQTYTDAYRDWREAALFATRDLGIPDRTPLAVTMRVRLAPKVMHKLDVDGCVKPVLDAVVGSRRDQWVTELTVSKRLADVGDEGIEVRVEW